MGEAWGWGRGGGTAKWRQEGGQGYLAELVERLQDVAFHGDLELGQDFGQRALYAAAHLQGFPVWGRRQNDCGLEPRHSLTQHPLSYPYSCWDPQPAPGPCCNGRLKALALPSPLVTPMFALTGFDSSAWLWEPLNQDSGSARVCHLLGSPPALCPTGTYPRLDSVSSSLKLSAIVVDRVIKGSFFCREPRIWESGGELVCGSSLPVKHATRHGSKWPNPALGPASFPGPPISVGPGA